MTLEHRSHLNYTDAFLHEVLRMQPIAPLAMPHTTTCDTSVGMYTGLDILNYIFMDIRSLGVNY